MYKKTKVAVRLEARMERSNLMERVFIAFFLLFDFDTDASQNTAPVHV